MFSKRRGAFASGLHIKPGVILIALAVLIAAAGAATGVVLSGRVTGQTAATVSQSLIVRDLAEVGGDITLTTVSDDNTAFTAAVELNTGDYHELHMILGNESNAQLVGQLTLVPPPGITPSVAGFGDSRCVAREGPYTWIFTLPPETSNAGVDLKVRFALADDSPPGFYAVDAQLKQIDRDGACDLSGSDIPLAVDDEYSIEEDGTLVTPAPGILDNDTDFNDDPLIAILVGGPSDGTLTLNVDGSFVYTPNPDFTGFDTFTYKANDGTNDSNVATVTIVVTPEPDPPVALDDAYTIDEDTVLNVAAPGVLLNDSDIDGDPLTAALQSGPSNGTVVLSPDGSFIYTSASNFFGTDSFTYQAYDDALGSNIATVTITVDPVQDVPVAVDDAYTIDEDDLSFIVSVPGVMINDFDVDGDSLTAALVSGPSNGFLNFIADGSFYYAPDGNFNGTDSFTYKVNDGTSDSNVATVIITVTPVNDLPFADDDAYVTDEDVALTVPTLGVLANDSDPDGDPLTAILVTGPSDGSVVLNGDGSFTYTPDPNFNGTDSFTYKANDGIADSNVATVTITIDSVEDVPVAVDDVYTTDEDTILIVPAPGVTSNDSDGDGDALTAILVTATSNGSVTLNGDGSFTYTPNTGFLGTDSFTYKVNDGTADSNVATVTITIAAVNDAPVAVDDTYTTIEDTALNAPAPGILGNDTDPDGDTLTVVLVGSPTNGTLSLSANGSFTYTPDADFNGTDSFTYMAHDGALFSNLATVTITVTAVNDAPVAVDDVYGTTLNTTLVVGAPGVMGNDIDVDGDTLTTVLVTATSNGTLTLNADGSFTYVPTTGFIGVDSFTYKVNDGLIDSNVATVTITVGGSGGLLALDDAYTMGEDTALNVSAPGVLSNDTGGVLTAILVTGPSNGTLTLNANGSFTYIPTANFNGVDTFTYKANDGSSDSNVATVTITVTAVNDAPLAVNDSYSTSENTTLNVTAPGVLGNDGDIDGDGLTAILVSTTSNGTLTLNSDGSFAYVPNTGFSGVDTFTYMASDGSSFSNVATVTITVSGINDVPVAVNDAYSTNEDTVLNVSPPGVLGNDTDGDGDTLTAILVSGPSNGTLTLNSNGSFTYVPNTNFNGSDSFTYKANDGTVDSNVATVTITVNVVNDAPVAVNDSYSGVEDTVLSVTAPGVLVNDNDVEGNTLTAILVSAPSNGTVTLNSNGSFVYTPNANFNGVDTFTYKANDGTSDSNAAIVTITISGVNDAPVAVDDAYSTSENTAVNVSVPGVLSNDGDIDGDALTAVLISSPSNGTVTLNSSGSFTYTPNTGYTGTDTFTYKANDGSLLSNVATVTITINAVNTNPVANDDSYNMIEDGVLNVSAPGVLGNDTDVLTLGLTAILVSGPSNGTLTLNSNGSFTYTPSANYFGVDTFTYKANDGVNDSNVATVTINITAVNDAPVAVNDAYGMIEDTVLNVSAPGVQVNDSDVEGSGLTAILVSSPSNGTVTLNGDGSFSYTPNANYSGVDTFTYMVSDGALLSNVATVTITITGVNDAPVAVDDAYSTPENTALVVSVPGVLGNDSDVEGGSLTAILISSPTNGTVTLNSNGSFTYTPSTGFTGTDTFTYKASDGALLSNVATVTITVDAVGGSPVANDDLYSGIEDTVLNVSAPGVLGNDTDFGTSGLTAILVSGPSNGTLTLNSNGSFTYTPNANFNGVDTFTYKANDGSSDSNVATVTITITAINDAPLAVDDAYSTSENTTLNISVPGVLANDSDVEGGSLTAILVGSPSNGSVTLNGNGSFTYIPNTGYSGTDTFTYQVHDGALLSNVATVTITITGVNSAPVAVNDSYSTAANTTLNVSTPGVLGNDTDGNGDTLTAILVSGPSNGTLTLNSNGSFTYTPNTGFTGTDTFTYKANDGSVDSNVATVTINVSAVNVPPVAVNDTYSAIEDTVLSISAPGVLSNDTDGDGDTLTSILVSGPSNGTLTLSSNGSFVYTPNANYNGTDTFTYKANDGSSDSNIATVTINITSINDAPLAVDDAYGTAENTTLNVSAPGVLGNDSDVEGSSLTAILIGSPSNGAVTLNSNGSFTYIPNTGYTGTDTFTYRVHDGALLSNVATVTITITGVNVAPVAVDDAYTTAANTPLTVSAPGVLANDTDGNGDTLTAILASGPSNGTLTLNSDGSFTYTPNTGFNGTDTFLYLASEGALLSNVATVTITVGSVNQAPVANNDTYSGVEDTVLNLSAPGVLANDTDGDGDTLTAILVTSPSNGTVTLSSNGSFVYTPNANFNGVDTFTYKANDGTVDSNIATVTITIIAINDAPLAVDDAYSTIENTVLNVSAPGVQINDSDVEGSSLTSILVSSPANGTVTLNSNGSFTYTPNTGFSGTDTFTYRVHDGALLSNLATVTITVSGVNDAPVAVDDAYSAIEDTPLIVSAPGVLANDTDADGDTLTAILVGSPSNGVVTLNSNGSFSYTPNANFNGVDTFTYKASDGALLSNTATVTITIAAVNDVPVANNDSYSTPENTTLNVSAAGVLTNDTDIDLDTLTAILVSGPSNGTLTLNSNGSFVYTPNTGFNGTDTFTYKANDGSADSNIATVTITVSGVNVAPVAVDDTYSTPENTTLTVPAAGVLSNDTDGNGDTLTAILVSGPSNGTLTLNSNGSFVYTPSTGFTGTDTFTYKANDGTVDSNVATVTITVSGVNVAPVAVDDAYSTPENTTLTVPASGVLSNDTDGNGDTLTAILVSGTSSGTLTLNSNGSFVYTPNTGFTGTDSFTYIANDGSLFSNVATVTITVSGVNVAPVAVDDAYSTPENTTLTVPAAGVLSNDTDGNGDTLTAILVSGPSNGTLTLSSNGSFVYTPSTGFTGTDTFTYIANDGSLFSNVATVTITVSGVNVAPVAVNDAYSTPENTTLTVPAAGVLSNDTDGNGDTLTAILVSGPSNGTLTLNSNGSFVYTPSTGFTGTDTFTYKANDGTVDSNVATVTIIVSWVNVAPVAVDDAYNAVEDTPLTITAPGVLGNDTDGNGDTLTAILMSGPSNGTVTLNSNGSFVYTPNANFNGVDTFTYKANDGAVDSNIATVTITVSPVNDEPVAMDDAYSTNQNTTLNVSAPGVQSNDSDVEGTTLISILVSSPSNGTVTLNGNGSFIYTPTTGFTGTDTYTYRVHDGALLSNVATVTITVNAVNAVPVAVDDAYTVDQDTTLNVSAPGVLGNDTDGDGDTLTAILVSGPSNGTLTLNSNGSFVYTPTTGFTGTDTFTYKANDGIADSNVATVTITVEDDGCLWVVDQTEDKVFKYSETGTLLGTFTLTSPNAKGKGITTDGNSIWTLDVDDEIVYRYNMNGVFQDSFALTTLGNHLEGMTTDGTSLWILDIDSSPNVFRYNLSGVYQNDSFTLDAGNTHSEGITWDGGYLWVVDQQEDKVFKYSTSGTLLDSFSVAPATHPEGITGDGTNLWIVDTDTEKVYQFSQSGTLLSSFDVDANNHDSGGITRTLCNAQSSNSAPVANDDAYTTDEDTALNVSAPGALGNDTDGDGDTLTAVLVSGPSNGTLTLNGDGSFTYTPTTGFTGTDTFTYKANDGTVNSNVATVILTVSASSGLEMLVVDKHDKKVYLYEEDGTYTGNFSLNSSNGDAQGITTDGTTIWVVDDGDKKVYAYDGTGNYVSGSSFSLNSANGDAAGIAVGGSYLWVVDMDEVFQYTIAGAYVGVFDIESDNNKPEGIAANGSQIWVVDDSSGDDVYKYTAGGAYQSQWELFQQDHHPIGMTTRDSLLWYVDHQEDAVYKYDTSGTYLNFSFQLTPDNTDPKGIAVNPN